MNTKSDIDGQIIEQCETECVCPELVLPLIGRVASSSEAEMATKMFSLLSILIHFLLLILTLKNLSKMVMSAFIAKNLRTQSRRIKNGRKIVEKCLNLIHRRISLRFMSAPSFSGDEMFYRKCSNL